MFFFKKKTAGKDTADTPLKRKAKAMPMTKKEPCICLWLDCP